MPDGLYLLDGLAWSEQQASLLRRLAAGERVNDAVDWPNLIEEIEALGRSELKSCESLLVQALCHLIEIHAWPDSTAVFHWRGEAVGFLAEARRAFSPSMWQRIDLPGLYAEAVYRVAAIQDDSGTPLALPEVCPFVLEDVVAERPPLEPLLALLMLPLE